MKKLDPNLSNPSAVLFWGVTVADVNKLAEKYLGRRLTEDELDEMTTQCPWHRIQWKPVIIAYLLCKIKE